jgi:hypothetical protein
MNVVRNSHPENRFGTGVHNGRFEKGRSGNPGGRPRGLARTTRELVGDDGEAIVRFWLETMNDATLKTADRLEASRLLADRGWGPAPQHAPVEDDDPLGLMGEDTEALARDFDAAMSRLAARRAPVAVNHNGTGKAALASAE